MVLCVSACWPCFGLSLALLSFTWLLPCLPAGLLACSLDGSWLHVYTSACCLVLLYLLPPNSSHAVMLVQVHHAFLCLTLSLRLWSNGRLPQKLSGGVGWHQRRRRLERSAATWRGLSQGVPWTLRNSHPGGWFPFAETSEHANWGSPCEGQLATPWVCNCGWRTHTVVPQLEIISTYRSRAQDKPGHRVWSNRQAQPTQLRPATESSGNESWSVMFARQVLRCHAYSTCSQPGTNTTHATQQGLFGKRFVCSSRHLHLQRQINSPDAQIQIESSWHLHHALPSPRVTPGWGDKDMWWANPQPEPQQPTEAERWIGGVAPYI